MILSQQRIDSLFSLKCFIIYFVRNDRIHIYIIWNKKPVESYIKYYFIAHTYLKLKNY